MENEDLLTNIRFQYNCSNVDWDHVSSILESVNMAHFEGKVHRTAFENSCTVIFAYNDDELIGFGRAISDRAYQAAIFDVAVSQAYQGRGLGRMIVNSILKSIPQCNFILYASPGKEGFYENLDFKRMKTGMALFRDADKMQIRGFTQ